VLDVGPYLRRKNRFEIEPPVKTFDCKLQQERSFRAVIWRIQTRTQMDLPQRFRFLQTKLLWLLLNEEMNTLSVRLRGDAVESCGPTSRVAF